MAFLLPAGAVSIGFTDRTTFLNQAGPWTLIDFDTTIGSNPFINYSGAGALGLTEAGVNFVSYRTIGNAVIYTMIAGDSMTCCLASVDGSAALYLAWSQESTGTLGTTLISLPAGVTSFGFDFINNTSPTPYPYQFTLSDGSVFPGITGQNPQFFGFVSDVPISTFLIEMPLPAGSGDSASRLAIDNVVFSASVPEPSTWPIVAVGLALFTCFRRRRIRPEHRNHHPGRP